MKLTILIFNLFFLVFSLAIAQDHHQYHMPMDSIDSSEHKGTPSDTLMNMNTMDMHKDSTMMNIPSAFSKYLPMNVNGSGTSWLPINSPMYMNLFRKNGWNFMLHYGIFFTYTNQNVNRDQTQRGNAAFVVPNWTMLMINRLIGKRGLFIARGMFSLDFFTTGGGQGYPLIFATGETWKGKPIIDHQHPHDLISELSIGYSYAFNKSMDLYAYFGLPGEPCLGPPAFMHRPSALDIPSSPISHHWQDATHISYGVGTLGFRYKRSKIEGSIFNGNEPNENRKNIDQPRFNSYSARLSINPNNAFALQVSYGFLKKPEALEPFKNIERFTASVIHNAWLRKECVISNCLIWGMNKFHDNKNGDITFGNSVLFESNLQTKWYSFSTRMEYVQKTNEELKIPSDDLNFINNIGSILLVASRYLSKNKYFWLDLGLLGTTYIKSNNLYFFYGKHPYSLQIFLRVIPPRMKRMNMN